MNNQRSDSQPEFDNNDIFWDEITAIKTMGLKPVYDLTIPNTHNFVANDICVHNTSFAMNIAEYVAVEKQVPVAVFSMEMSDEQLTMRLISSLAQVNLQSVRTGQLNDDEWFKITKTVNQLEKSPLFIDQTPALNPTELRARVRRLAREQGQLGLVVIDYLQLMQVPDNKENRTNEVSEISRSLKALAKELNVPVIALSQLNRSLEQRSDRRPKMSDLRESGCLTGDSLVTCADTGRLVPIRDLVGRTDFSVWGLNTKTMQLERAKVSRAFGTGTKPVFRLTTRLGRTICATGNHQFYTPYGWKRLNELKSDDYLALPRHISVKKQNIKPAMQKLGMTHRQLYAELNMAYAGMTLFNINMSRDRTLQVAKVLNSKKLRQLAQSDIYWDKIASIEPAGEAEVFDLSVPHLHNFLCNSLIVHNSLEQDADLIVFIYRDEVYNEDTPDKGKAEIIIAKQRNGPIGVIHLFFRGQTTQFENYTDQYYEE